MSKAATLADGLTLGMALALALLTAALCAPALRHGQEAPAIVTLGQLAAPSTAIAYGAPPRWFMSR
jgi:hypothetical protein